MSRISSYLMRIEKQIHDCAQRGLSYIVAEVKYYVVGIIRYLSEKDVFLWGQAIAFKELITLVPLIILALGIFGQILRRAEPFQAVAQIFLEFLPPTHSDQIIPLLESLQRSGHFFTFIGVAGLLYSAVSLFTTLRIVIGNVFKEEWHHHRTTLPGYLFDLRMTVQVGLLFMVTFGLSLLSQGINEGGLDVAQRLGLDYVWLREGWRRLFKTLGLLIPYLLSTAMFFHLLYFIPKPHPPKRSALIGAIITGLLWEVAKYGFAFYAAQIDPFEEFSALGDTFVLIIGFVFWAYYSAIVLIMGALIAVLHEKRHRIKHQRD